MFSKYAKQFSFPLPDENFDLNYEFSSENLPKYCKIGLNSMNCNFKSKTAFKSWKYSKSFKLLYRPLDYSRSFWPLYEFP